VQPAGGGISHGDAIQGVSSLLFPSRTFASAAAQSAASEASGTLGGRLQAIVSA